MRKEIRGYEKYECIIGLPHYQSTKRIHMPIGDRAAQFAPFAALNGHEELLQETADIRGKKEKALLLEDKLVVLNQRVEFLRRHLKERPEVEILYFEEDEGRDVSYKGRVKKWKNTHVPL